jgi:hypothetical protein
VIGDRHGEEKWWSNWWQRHELQQATVIFHHGGDRENETDIADDGSL